MSTGAPMYSRGALVLPLMPRSIAADVRWMTSGGLSPRSVESLLRRQESADRPA